VVTFVQELNETLRSLLVNRADVVILGEDLLDPYGGAFKVTQGLQRDFPSRVLTTPISEAALVGIANGMALRGLHPIVEIMFGDFITLCFDQLVNHSAKFRAMYAGRVAVPLVVRTPMGGGRGYGPTHSQSLEKLLLGVPHLDVVAPSLFGGPRSALVRAVEGDRPTVFIEHKLLYPASLYGDGALHVEVAHEDGYGIALVRNYASGDPDVTLVTYGGVSRYLERVLGELAQEEIRVLACLPERLHPLPRAVIAHAVSESGRAVVIEEGGLSSGWGAEVAALLQEDCWRMLRGPVRRVAARDLIVPAARSLESVVLPGPEDILKAVMEVLE
jgi:pyruvate/2-oxoglutarate/acetoin dehydrogenase E1 component